MYTGKKTTGIWRRLGWILSLLLAAVAITLGAVEISKVTFDFGTTIGGVNCSLCTPKEARKRLEKKMNESLKLYTMLPDGETQQYTLTDEQIQALCIEAEDIEVFEEMLNVQKQDASQSELKADKLFAVDKEAVREFLKTVPELGTNMVIPKNAYLKIGADNRIEIEPHICGNELGFEKALEYTVSALEAGESEVFLSEITQKEPDILMTDGKLQDTKSRINQVLDSVIKFDLPDGTTITLNINTMKNWVTETPDGSFSIDLEENLESFVEILDQKVREFSKTITFETTGLGAVSFTLPVYAKQLLDKEEQTAKIKEALLEGKETTVDLYLIEDPLALYKNCKTYIELDITRQKLWLYVDGKNILDGVDVVTGNESKNHGTPKGIYFLTYKTKGATLTDNRTYWSYVTYWMPFNGGIGFHDASWRNVFGGVIYLTNGSHGCVNMAKKDAATLYEYINKKMPIFIYAS